MKKEHPVLKARNLSIGYPDQIIAEHINFDIYKGELTAVIGINGSGKSTLLKTVSGDLPKRSGEIILENQPLQSLSSREIAEKISIVLSNPVISQNLTVYEIVALGRQPYTNWLGLLSDKDKAVVSQALQLIEIEDLVKKRSDELSDGQLQKVFIARAIAQNTELILLDEPTNHLDLYHKAFVFKMLKKLTEETNKTIVFATHELNLALQLCDQLILIQNKKVIAGSPQELISNKKLQHIFPPDLIRFNEETKTFQII